MPGSEPVRRHHERTDGVVGGPPAGVPEDVSVADRETQQSEQVEARVHAGEDHDVTRRCSRQAVGREVLVELLGRAEQLLEDVTGHGPTLASPARNPLLGHFAGPWHRHVTQRGAY